VRGGDVGLHDEKTRGGARASRGDFAEMGPLHPFEAQGKAAPLQNGGAVALKRDNEAGPRDQGSVGSSGLGAISSWTAGSFRAAENALSFFTSAMNDA